MTTPPANTIRLIEAEGTFWVQVVMDGCALERRGPFDDLEAAEATAIQFAAIFRVCRQPMRIMPATCRKRCA